MNDTFSAYLERCQRRINTCLPELVGNPGSEFAGGAGAHLDRLFEAMRYSLVNGGKRVRPLLVYASAQAVSPAWADDPALDSIAGAVECIHAYSLVHDDLPAMDNDALRRGHPTCHIAFDEATAILVGDALQARAFELLAALPGVEPALALRLVASLAAAAGPRGMVGGQAIDLAAVNRHIDIDHLQSMHQLKTGALIRAAVQMGALRAGADDKQLAALDHYARAIGLAFQVQDDIIDIECSTETLGKTQGADAALNKPTYPALLGLDRARELAQSLHREALDALVGFGENALRLRQLADFIISRRH